jgi:hypothetical protein
MYLLAYSSFFSLYLSSKLHVVVNVLRGQLHEIHFGWCGTYYPYCVGVE